MGLENFIPTIWSSKLFVRLQKALVFASPTVRTQSELIADAEFFGIKTDGMSKTPAWVFNEYVRPTLTILIYLSSK